MRRFLAEFLSDPRVVTLPRLLWLPILHGVILRTRPFATARKYALIWTSEGSPLAVHTARQAQALSALISSSVAHAMRYGEPSIAAGLERLSGCDRITVVPLYPQYSRSTTGSVRDAVGPQVSMVESFHDHPAYIAALASGMRRHWERNGRGEMLVMSFHGLPRRAVERGDPYERQCRETARLLAGALALGEAQWMVTFQSRFGAGEWLRPYTQDALLELAAKGIRRVDVVCPGFVSDCLETLHEIGIESRSAYLAAGGQDLRLVPCLNESAEWIGALAAIAGRGLEPTAIDPK